jgi:repressor LexA
MLKIRGDSMVDAGILDRDYVVVQKQQTASNGQIVAALVDGEEATVKTFERSANGITLVPANDNFEPVVYTDSIEILGIVVAVLRRID